MCQTQGPRATSGPWMNYLWPAWQNLFTIRAGPLVYHMRHHNTTNHIMQCPCVGTSITGPRKRPHSFISNSVNFHPSSHKMAKRKDGLWEQGFSRQVEGTVHVRACVSSVRRQCGCNERIPHKKTLRNEAPRQIQASGHDNKGYRR